MNDVYENIEEYSLNKERKILAMFYDKITDMPSNKNLQQIVA